MHGRRATATKIVDAELCSDESSPCIDDRVVQLRFGLKTAITKNMSRTLQA
jgi:hypothetical protein